MRKVLVFLLLLCAVLSLSGCEAERVAPDKTIEEWREEYPETYYLFANLDRPSWHVNYFLATADAVCVLTPLSEYRNGSKNYVYYWDGPEAQEQENPRTTTFVVDFRTVICRVDQVLYGDIQIGEVIALTGSGETTEYLKYMEVGVPFAVCMRRREDLSWQTWTAQDEEAFYLTEDGDLVPCAAYEFYPEVYGMKLEEFAERAEQYGPLESSQVNMKDGSIIKETVSE